MAFYLPNVKPRFFDANGDPLAGGKLWSYIAGTSTPLATYSDMDEETPNTNPVVLDANGEADIFLANATYKLILTDSADVPQWTQDDVEPWDETDADSGGGSSWSEHAITDGMAATDLEEQTVDFALYSSAKYECEILRGTTVIAGGPIEIQNLNGTGRVLRGRGLLCFILGARDRNCTCTPFGTTTSR